MTTVQLVAFLLLAPLTAAQNSPPRDPAPPPPYGLTNFNPSMAIIIVVLISAFFFMGFFSIYLRQCSGRDSNSVSRRGARNGSIRVRSRRAARGLDQAVIETFPTFAYSEVKNLKIGKGTLECAVCLCEFEDEETLRLLPKCSHVFHPDCIDMWLSSHVTCPVCRCNLAPTAPAADQVANPDELTDLEVGSDSDHHPDDRGEREIAVTIDEDRSLEQPEPAASVPNVINPGPNRPPRSGSNRRPKIAGRFPRSHSTGHSLVQPGENCERYTLRLPEHVRKEIMKGKLNRTTSCVAFPTEVSDGSVRRGRRGGNIGGEGSSRGRSFGRSDRAARSDRWMFSMAPPFIIRSFSVRSASTKRAGGAEGEQEGNGGTRTLLPSVKGPFDCLGGAKAGADSEESASVRPQRSATPVFTVVTSP